jgi:hypothetical protein
MANYTIKLINKIASFNITTKISESKSNGFVFKYNGNSYIISVHHFLPIINTQLDTNSEVIELKKIKNINWNELAIYECPDTKFLLNTKTVKNYRTRFIEKNMTIKIEIGNHFENYPMYDTYIFCVNPLSKLRCVYIRFLIGICKQQDFLNIANKFKGLSGTPILDIDNKLIGVFCKINIENNKDEDTFKIFGYILPSIYIIKSINKNNNESIFQIDTQTYDNIKLGKYEIQKDKTNQYTIYYLPTNSKLPLDVYFSLEGDEDKNIMSKNTKTLSCRQLKFVKNDYFDLNVNIIQNENKEYKLNTGFMSILLKNGHKLIANSIVHKYFNSKSLNDTWINVTL